MKKANNNWRGRNLKKKVLDLLKEDEFDQALETFQNFPARRVINPLFSFLCSTDSQIRWRAIMAVGSVVNNLANQDMESARVVMRRMMWNLNDESGGIGWGLPESMGEIMAQHEGLAQEYAKILMSYIQEDGNLLEHPPLQRGVLWGLGRLAQTRPEMLQDVAPYLHPFLASEDATLRGLAAWILGLLGGSQDKTALAGLENDETEITLFLNGTERNYRISELARKGLKGMQELRN
ncbi:MAG: HEAT repeat domain-containing protein [Deltaproteobacteria bacterium]|nr:MAG: HEAT repeat domain-containing protein [Deltaproteobacteria bacterium]